LVKLVTLIDLVCSSPPISYTSPKLYQHHHLYCSIQVAWPVRIVKFYVVIVLSLASSILGRAWWYDSFFGHVDFPPPSFQTACGYKKNFGEYNSSSRTVFKKTFTSISIYEFQAQL
jgi:hypothetical protein